MGVLQELTVSYEALFAFVSEGETVPTNAFRRDVLGVMMK